jgi:lysophospholipase
MLGATSGFLPNSTKADPNFLKCFKCAIVDRSRLMLPNPVDRSDFCQTCFRHYCYDPKNEPSANEITGRKLVFTDPDLRNEGSLKKQGVQLAIGIAAGVAALIAIVVAM